MHVSNPKTSYYYFSGGTTGKPKVIPFTENEWKKRSVYRAQCYANIGMTRKNKVVILLPFGPWVAGPSAQEAMSELGCTFFPIGLLKEKDEFLGLIDIIKNHGIDTIISMPSTIEILLNTYESGDNNSKLPLSTIITSGEYLSDSLRDRVNKNFNAKCISSYASSEFFIGVECLRNKNCYHFDPEILNVTVNAQELYFTHKIAEANQIKNYSLGDYGTINTEKCSCGMHFPKICLRGRKSGTFVVAGGVNVTSHQIINAIKSTDLSIASCIITITNISDGIDGINFRLFSKKNYHDSEKTLNLLTARLKNLSIDFNDVVNCGQVDLSVELEKQSGEAPSSKFNIKVNDLRIYER
jgi:phenylacetate-CoA ligase